MRWVVAPPIMVFLLLILLYWNSSGQKESKNALGVLAVLLKKKLWIVLVPQFLETDTSLPLATQRWILVLTGTCCTCSCTTGASPESVGLFGAVTAICSRWQRARARAAMVPTSCKSFCPSNQPARRPLEPNSNCCKRSLNLAISGDGPILDRIASLSSQSRSVFEWNVEFKNKKMFNVKKLLLIHFVWFVQFVLEDLKQSVNLTLWDLP